MPVMKAARLVVSKIFAGTAVLSLDVGFEACAVDGRDNTSEGQHPAENLGLALPHNQQRANRPVQFVWLAPPCGSTYRARELPAGSVRQGAAPRPLRNEAPHGVGGITEDEKSDMERENELARCAGGATLSSP